MKLAERVAEKLEFLTVLSESGNDRASEILRETLGPLAGSPMLPHLWTIIREKARQLLEKYDVVITDQLVERHARWIVYRDTTGY